MSETADKPRDSVELPTPTPWPMIMALAIVFGGAGVGIHFGFLIVGAVVLAFAVRGWMVELTPGRGHVHEPLAAPEARYRSPAPAPGTVDPLKPGAPSFRFRVPEHVHPISSGAKGGLIGGAAMAIPAMLYGYLDHGSVWLPINLLAGIVVPDVVDVSLESLKQFQLGAFVLASVIHLAFSVTFGLLYGVLLPMLPSFRGSAIFWGGVVMPIIWSGVCHGLMGLVNPALREHVNWPWFVASQFVYGATMSYVVHQSEKVAVAKVSPLKVGDMT